MNRDKLNLKFHNPNNPDVFGKQILKICIDASIKKLEKKIQNIIKTTY